MSDKLGLSAAGRRLVAQLQVPRSAADLVAGGAPEALVAAMQAHGLLEPQSATRQSEAYSEIFGGWKSQKGMLIDHTRTLAFRRAIEAVVRPGDRVVDVGTGSGILAMCAGRAGAGAVWGLELTAMAEHAARLAADNGLSAVRIVQGDAADFDPDGPVDLVMGEFAGLYMLEEWRHYAAFVRLRDRLLRPGGQVLPRAGRMFLSAIDSRRLYMDRGYGFWEAPVYGFDFSHARASDIARPTRYIVTADNREIVDTAELCRLDFATGTEADYSFETELTFRYAGAGAFHGLIGHFELDLAPGHLLSTSMAARETCWHQSYFPMPQIQVPAGGTVTLGVRSFIDEVTEEIGLALRILHPSGSEGAQERVFVLN